MRSRQPNLKPILEAGDHNLPPRDVPIAYKCIHRGYADGMALVKVLLEVTDRGAATRRPTVTSLHSDSKAGAASAPCPKSPRRSQPLAYAIGM